LADRFRGTGKLVTLWFRKDRLKLTVWLLILVGITLSVAHAYPSVYRTEEDLMAAAMTMENPAMVAMLGPGYEVSDYTSVAPAFATEMLLFTAVAVAIMNILLMGRSTRADEDEGQMELVLSLPVGRLSHLAASFIEGIVANVLLALLVGASLALSGLDGFTPEGSFLYGALLGAAGLVFSGLTAVAAQLAETSRGATGLAFGILIGAYTLRAIGDVNLEVLSMPSPLGWIVRSKVFADNAWWPVALSLAVFLLALVAALVLNGIRDMGAGFLPARKGRSHASPFLTTPLGFIFRQQRGTMLAWAIALFLLSASFGAILGDLETYFADMELIQAYVDETLPYSLAEQFATLTIAILSLFSTVPVIMTVLRLKGEEMSNRTEHLYSRAVSRARTLLWHLLASLMVGGWMQGMIALGFWMTGADSLGPSTGSLLQSAFAYLPALWCASGLAVLLVGLLPKATGWIWLYLGYCFMVIYLQDLLAFPDWLTKASVFEHIPRFPLETLNVVPLLVLCALTVGFGLAGAAGYNRRDLAG